MWYAGLFFLELLVLFFLSKKVSKSLSFFFYRKTRSKKITIYLLSFLFFPGTVLHELSHAFMAVIFFVPVDRMEFIPQIQEDYVKMGSVQIGQTDFFRRFFIGTAPLIFGSSILIGLLFYATQNSLFTDPLYLILILYCAFEIGNTMYSSKKDMEGAIELLVTCIFVGSVITLATFFLGLSLPVEAVTKALAHLPIEQTFMYGSILLFIPLGIDVIILLAFQLLPKAHHHLTHRHHLR